MNNLKQARKAKGLTQTEVAKIIGITQNGYSYWETGKSKIDNEQLKKLAELFDVSTDYLIGNDDVPKRNFIPVLGNVSAGIPIEAITDIIDYEEIDADMASSGEYFGLRIRGSSMEPKMSDGDVVIVRKQNDAETGNIVVALVNGESATVKKIKYERDGVALIPLNPAYDIQFYSADEVEQLPVRVIGRVVELRAKF